MGRAKYHAYLASRPWDLKREAVMKRAAGRCERCHKAPPDQVHHLSYAHTFDEPLEDLQAICKPCHEFLSGKTVADPATNKAKPKPPLKCFACGFECGETHARNEKGQWFCEVCTGLMEDARRGATHE